jgi:hypothetical protein
MPSKLSQRFSHERSGATLPPCFKDLKNNEVTNKDSDTEFKKGKNNKKGGDKAEEEGTPSHRLGARNQKQEPMCRLQSERGRTVEHHCRGKFDRPSTLEWVTNVWTLAHPRFLLFGLQEQVKSRPMLGEPCRC